MKALALLSGGLDSRLAIKIIQDQGIEVEAMHFKLPFEGCCLPDCSFKFCQIEMVKLHIVDATKGKHLQDYLDLIKNPKHGYGSAINPCVDCRIWMFKKAKRLMKKIGADFIVTGEVLRQRPMTQRKDPMFLIEKECKLDGKILRPLTAKRLPETDIEKEKGVDRSKLLDIEGRRRTIQLELAKKYKLKDFPMPAGGCTLCEKDYSRKVKDLIENKDKISPKDVQLLTVGRHFRFKDKIIVGRNEIENNLLMHLKNKSDYMFEVPDVGSPTTILQGASKETIKKAAQLTARYADSHSQRITVKYGTTKFSKEILVTPISEKEIEKLRI